MNAAPYALDDLATGLIHDLLKLEDASARSDALVHHASVWGVRDTMDVLAQFVGIAVSVVRNCREEIEIFSIVEGGTHPHTAETINLPSLEGAVKGATNARGVDPDGLCEGCAFRVGTVASQCLPTVVDADWCATPGEEPFLCHLDERGEPVETPTKACRGFALARASRRSSGSPDAPFHHSISLQEPLPSNQGLLEFAKLLEIWGECDPDPDFLGGDALNVILTDCGRAGRTIRTLAERLIDDDPDRAGPSLRS